MTIDCHLKLDGIKGESTHKLHKDDIALQSWDWNVTNASNTGGGGSGQGKGTPGALSFVKKYDISSPTISQKCASGKHFKEASVFMSLSGGEQLDFLTIKLKEVFITNHQVSAGTGGEVTDHISLSYGDIEYIYKPQKADGSLGGDVKFGWDTRTTDTR
jgi:type VI secretion system secreted protein Hcp